MVGILGGLTAAGLVGGPGRRISAVDLTPRVARALGGSTTLNELRARGDGRPAPPTPADSDPAAVVFTSGATGPSNWVSYRHHQLQAQRDVLARLYDLSAADRCGAAF